jgi:hypothetical protein
MFGPGFSIIGFSWMALLCGCTLVTELIESAADAALPVPSPTSWPWGGESLNYHYCAATNQPAFRDVLRKCR